MITQVSYRYVQTVGFWTQNGRGFADPVDVALARDGVMYVLNRGSSDTEEQMFFKRVTVCTVGEEYLFQFSSGGKEGGQMMWPVSIALDKDEQVYISDQGLNRISIFSKDGNFLDKWGTRGRGEGEFDRPAGIVFDEDDNLLVVDGMNSRVQRYTKDGRFLGGWGKLGNSDGEFSVPWGITLDHLGAVYVADWRNDRIQKFDADGRHLASWGTSGDGDGEFNRPSGVAVDREGVIYVADRENERVQVLGPDGSFRAKLRGEATLSNWAQDYFISNQDQFEERQNANKEPPLTLFPFEPLAEESANIEKYFWGPTSVKVDDQDRLYVVDSGRARIQIYEKGVS